MVNHAARSSDQPKRRPSAKRFPRRDYLLPDHFADAMIWSQNYAPLGSVGGIGADRGAARRDFARVAGVLACARANRGAGRTVGGGVGRGGGVSHAGAARGGGGRFGRRLRAFPHWLDYSECLFIYDLSVETGQFAVLQRQVSGVSRDRRIQALLIAFGLGAFIEGAAGFGTPVAISGALMIGLGFRPLEAAKLALIGNTAPVAFGALGTPLLALAKVTNS